MLNIQQIEALRKANPQLYEALKRLAGASLGPNQGWSLDNQITDGANFARVSSSALTSNQIDPTKSGVLMRGSVPPTWSGVFTYVSTTSSLTWSWSGLVIYRADGTTTAIPNGSVAVTGLTAATTYYFYPYWDETAGALAWVATGTGSPAYAQAAKTNIAAQQQALQGRIPLSQGAIAAATTSSGAGGGSGGGSGSCLRAGTMVLTRERGTVPIETCTVGEHLRCPSTRGAGRRRRGVVGAQHAVPGGDAWHGAAHSPSGESGFRSAGSSPASSSLVGARGFLALSAVEGSPAKNATHHQGLQPRSRQLADANEGWTRIVRLEVRDADTFIRLHLSDAESLDVTPHHIFTLADGSPMRAERLCLSDILVGRFGRLTLTKIEVISPSTQHSGVGAPLAAPGKDPWRDVAHSAVASGGSADVECGGLPAGQAGLPPLSRVPACRGAVVEASFDQKAAGASSRTPQVPGEDACAHAVGSPNAPGVSEAPWQKVTVSCEPSHEFFAGRHSASILTHNYTFSS